MVTLPVFSAPSELIPPIELLLELELELDDEELLELDPALVDQEEEELDDPPTCSRPLFLFFNSLTTLFLSSSFSPNLN